MKRLARIRLIVLPIALALVLASVTFAQSVTGYDLSWWTVDGGGTTSNVGGEYTLCSAIGQPDAGVLTGDDYTLAGGFSGGAAPAPAPDRHQVYLPLVLRNH